MAKKRSWTEQELRNAVFESYSVRQVMLKLGLAPQGGSYTQMGKYIKELSLDTHHFTGQLWNKGKK